MTPPLHSFRSIAARSKESIGKMRSRRVLIALTTLALLGVLALAVGARYDNLSTMTVSIRYLCDPTTFARIGCVRDDDAAAHGSQTLAGFQAEVGQEHSAGAWRYNPSRYISDDDVSLTLTN